MSHKCQNGSCSDDQSSSSSASGCGCNCGCGCGCSCGCAGGNQKCNCDCHHHHHQKYSDELLHLADKAWMEVLKDKIKDQILKTSGSHLTKLAELVSEANHALWTDKMAEKKAVENFDQKLRELLFKKK